MGTTGRARSQRGEAHLANAALLRHLRGRTARSNPRCRFVTKEQLVNGKDTNRLVVFSLHTFAPTPPTDYFAGSNAGLQNFSRAPL